MRAKLIVVFLFVFHVNHSWAQVDSLAVRYSETISSDELKQHLMVFASDEMEGRETGMAGQRKAADYLVNYYKDLGVLPCVDGSYLQEFSLKKEQVKNSIVDVKGKIFRFIEDFYFFDSFSFDGEIDLSTYVFAGYGIDEKSYSDYSDVDLKGRIVVCLSGEPLNSKGISRISGTTEMSPWSYDPGLKIEAAQKRGARAVVIIQQDYDRFIPRIRFWLESPKLALDYPEVKLNGSEPIPFFFISPRLADQLITGSLGGDCEKLIRRTNRRGPRNPRICAGSGVIHVKREIVRLTSSNVLAFIEGSDPLLKDEVVVISSHYDHIGVINGVVNNGADDDGSGTVTTLEIAEAFVEARADGNGARRSVLILNVSGEEKGLLGSEWYSEYPVFPLEHTVCDLNIDMIGRKDEKHNDNDRYVYLIGSDKLSSELHAISERMNKLYSNLTIDYTYNDPADPNRFYYRSDHYNFARKNIPVIFYFSGVHEDYHQPGDDPEKILYDKMAVIGRLIFHTAWEIANRDERLKVDVSNSFEED